MKSFWNNLAKRSKPKIFLDKLVRYLPPQAKILDIGCGDGAFLYKAKAFFQCTGIELSDYLASLAKRDSNLNILVGDFLSVDFSTNQFDGITMISLLEHLIDPLASLQKCFDLLNKNGTLLLKTVNFSCLNRMIMREEWIGFRPPDHIVYFTPKNLTCLLKKIGFSRVKITSWPFNDNMYCEAWK